MTKLVLFDIDGTLLTVRGAGAKAMMEAVATVTGLTLNTEHYSLSGKTDTQIVLELVTRSGGNPETVQSQFQDIWVVYLEQLAQVLQQLEPNCLPGVPELLAELHGEPRVVLGLLTGNVEKAAWQKVEWVNLATYFRLGAFGDHAPERCLLPQRAVDQAQQLTGQTFSGKDILIIGDTPNDITCGQSLGVKSIAVATGKFSATQLAAHEPDVLLADLSQTEAVLAAILGD